MKPRELISYAIILVLIALLYRTCQKPKERIIDNSIVVTDTIVRHHTDTFIKRVDRPVPYETIKMVTVSSVDTISVTSPTWSDSIRYYSDSTGNKRAKAIVNSTVQGVLLGQDIRLVATLNDSTFTRVVTRAYPYKYQFTPFVSADLRNGIGLGGALSIDRLNVGYTYYLNKSNEIRVGWTIFRK